MTSPPAVLSGATAPRVEVRPAGIVGTHGDLGADLMAAAGKPLETWQQDSVDLAMSYRSDGRWACYEYCEWVARQNGKGGIAEARVLAGFLVLGEELIIWSAHEYKTAMEAFRRLRALIRALGTAHSDTLVEVDGVLIKISNTNGEEGFERVDTGQRIKFIARSKSSGRGFSGDLNVIDEAFALTDDQSEALMPTLVARPNAQVMFLSSPPLTGTSGTVMFLLKSRAEKGDETSLGYRDWGVQGNLDDLGKLDIDDVSVWAAANPALGRGRVTEETIGRLRRAMSARGFAREVLGVWPVRITGGGAIDPARWAELADPSSRRVGDVAIAVDIAPQRDYAAVALYGTRADGVGHLQLIRYGPGTDWIVAYVLECAAVLPLVAIAMGRATAASLEVELGKHGITRPEKADEPLRGQLAVPTAAQMMAATGGMLDAVRDGSFRHTKQAELDASVEGAVLRQVGDSIAWARREADTDTSPVMAASLAQWAMHARAHLVLDGEYDVLESVY